MDKLSELYHNYSTVIIIIEIIAAIVTIGGCIFGIIHWGIKYVKKRRKEQKAEKKSLRGKLYFNRDDFQNYEKDIFIPIDVTDPQHRKPKKRLPLFGHFIEIVKRKKVDDRFICILGDIGSGKTATMFRLFQKFKDEYRSQSSMPPYIKLFTMRMGYEGIKNEIDKIPQEERGDYIFMLDALDECEEARASLRNTPDGPCQFMDNLAKDTKDFAFVVVSCRKQFFISEEPDKISIKVGNKYPDPFQHWHKLYIEPFNLFQVLKYLFKKFGKTKNMFKIGEAIRIVYGCKDVFLRPMILSFIDILLVEYGTKKRSLTIKEILDVVIFNWISREADGDEAKTKELLNASLCTAAYMYKHKLNYLNETDYKAMCEEHGIDDQGNLLRVQSLLTNDTKEGFRFAHQSFYEHLLAYWFFLNPWDIGSLQGMLEIVPKNYLEIAVSYQNKDRGTKMTQMLETNKIDILLVASGVGLMSTCLQSVCIFDINNRLDFELQNLMTIINQNNSNNINSHKKPDLLSDDKYNEVNRISHQLQIMSIDLIKLGGIESDLSQTLYNKYKGELTEAEEKSLELYQRMAELSHAAFDKDVEEAKNLLARIQEARKPKP